MTRQWSSTGATARAASLSQRRTGWKSTSANGPLDVDAATFRSVKNRGNDYLIDRAVQKRESFTGIDGINVQDRAIQEGMGTVVDRSREHLGPADRAIIQARRLLRQAVEAAAAGGEPAGIAPSYYRLRAAEGVLPADADWRERLRLEETVAEIH